MRAGRAGGLSDGERVRDVYWRREQGERGVYLDRRLNGMG